MERGRDYEWELTRDLPETDIRCGFCGSDITSKTGYAGWIRVGGGTLPQRIYICHKCGQANFFTISDEQIPKFKEASEKFSEMVVKTSPRFIEIHKQSQLAEIEGFDEIAGLGYGKALEFLVKDHLIKKNPDQEDEIKKDKLYSCIHVRLDNPKIRVLAERARVIRNDETHYERKYEDTDITDLKRLISAMAAWIDLEAYTTEATE